MTAPTGPLTESASSPAFADSVVEAAARRSAGRNREWSCRWAESSSYPPSRRVLGRISLGCGRETGTHDPRGHSSRLRNCSRPRAADAKPRPGAEGPAACSRGPGTWRGRTCADLGLRLSDLARSELELRGRHLQRQPVGTSPSGYTGWPDDSAGRCILCGGLDPSAAACPRPHGECTGRQAAFSSRLTGYSSSSGHQGLLGDGCGVIARGAQTWQTRTEVLLHSAHIKSAKRPWPAQNRPYPT